MWSGFSSTSLCVFAEPMVLTIPSPTRAITVSSPAPPTSRSMLVRTVTRETAISWIPSLATAAIRGVSITLGMTDIFTAAKTSRPARSMDAPRLSGMARECGEPEDAGEPEAWRDEKLDRQENDAGADEQQLLRPSEPDQPVSPEEEREAQNAEHSGHPEPRRAARRRARGSRSSSGAS
jgi:hypothetical protein